MADEKITSILSKLQKKATLSPDELTTLQSALDRLEVRGRSSHHETTSHHHTSALLDLASEFKQTPTK